jgi:hypothetical protein
MGVGAVLGRVLIAAPGAKLHDSPDTNIQGFQLLSDDPPPEIPNQQPHAAILWQGEGLKTHTLFAVKGTQSAKCDCEAIGSSWEDHQILVL